MIKWGFIGCGEVTKTKSGPAFQKVEHSEVVAVMSRDGAKAKAYAKERGIRKWYDDAQELCKQAQEIADQLWNHIANPKTAEQVFWLRNSLQAEAQAKSEKVCLTKARQTFSKLKKIIT